MKNEIATFSAGCFWCTEAIFKRLDGVESVISGYSGGFVINPTYEQVCSGTTGHTEAVQIEFDPDVITYKELLDVFWSMHDPTTLNRQGNDVGPQYSSVIYYHSKEQKQIAQELKEELDKIGIYKNKIVTEILPFTDFYKAEEFHQNFYEENPNSQYCNLIITPKIDKLLAKYKEKIRVA